MTPSDSDLNIACLPGMDGSGLLFDSFIRKAPDSIRLDVFPLNHRTEMTAAGHAREMIGRLKPQHRTLLAESYSSLIAYHMALQNPNRFDRIIFVAGFLSSPGRLARWHRLLPMTLIRQHWLTRPIARHLLFRSVSESQPELATHFSSALTQLPTQTLRSRLHEVAHLEPATQAISPSCLYLQPSHDLLVSRAAVRKMARLVPQMHCRSIIGTHFLLQTNPDGCWQAIGSFLEQLQL